MKNPNLVNRTALSVVVGKNLSTIDSWVRQGMPYVERGNKGGGWLFDTAKVFAWREKRMRNESWSPERIEIEEGKRRKIAAEARMLEIQLEEKCRQVISRQEVDRGLSYAYTTIRQRLRTIPERIVSQIIGQKDEHYIRELFLEEIDDALLELSQLDYDFDEKQSQNGECNISPTTSSNDL